MTFIKAQNQNCKSLLNETPKLMDQHLLTWKEEACTQLKIPAVFETTHAGMPRQALIKMRPVSVVMWGSYAGARVLGEAPVTPAVTFLSLQLRTGF